MSELAQISAGVFGITLGVLLLCRDALTAGERKAFSAACAASFIIWIVCIVGVA